MSHRSWVITLLLLLLWPNGVPGQVPMLINYQGTLEGVTGQNQVLFAIYAQEAPGSQALWEESREITPQNGRFTVLLGSITPLTADMFGESGRYLAVTVNGQTLSPRQRIVSVPFAFRSNHAKNVANEHITPKSFQLSDGKAALDSLGLLSVTSVQTESLAVGGRTVINQAGAWVGPPVSVENILKLKSISQTTVNTAEVFFLNSKWVHFAKFTPSVTLETAGKLDVRFVGQLSSPNGMETRVTIRKTADNTVLGPFGNVAGAQPSPASQGATVYNQAIIDLEAGTYRVFIEHRSNAVAEATLRSGSLIVKTYN